MWPKDFDMTKGVLIFGDPPRDRGLVDSIGGNTEGTRDIASGDIFEVTMEDPSSRLLPVFGPFDPRTLFRLTCRL
jgi:hypothetical protein